MLVVRQLQFIITSSLGTHQAVASPSDLVKYLSNRRWDICQKLQIKALFSNFQLQKRPRWQDGSVRFFSEHVFCRNFQPKIAFYRSSYLQYVCPYMMCSNIILLLLQILHQCARSRVWLHFYPATFYQEGEIPSEIAHIAFADGGNRTWAAFAESQCVIHCSVVSWHGRKKLTCCFFIGHVFRFFGFRGPSFRSRNRNLWRRKSASSLWHHQKMIGTVSFLFTRKEAK